MTRIFLLALQFIFFNLFGLTDEMIHRIYELPKKQGPLNENEYVYTQTPSELGFRQSRSFEGVWAHIDSSSETPHQNVELISSEPTNTTEDVPNNPKPLRVLVRSRWNEGGEMDMLIRLKVAASNLGWITEDDIYNPEKPSVITEKYDFIINLTPGLIPYLPGVKNYAVFAHPNPPPVLDAEGRLLEKYFAFDGYLFTLQHIQPIIRQFKELNKTIHYIQWYPTERYYPYKKVELNKLTFIVCHWGNRLTDGRYKDLYCLLDNASYCLFYSIDEKNKSLYPNSYVGQIPYDGESLVKTFSDGGINLVLHSDIHNNAEIPSGRIFEAAAASCVIICDSNAFVKKNFGDSVLYFDHNLDPLSMFKQIDDHMQWIFEHPDEALEKAKKAHEIFEKNYVLENQLLNLKHLHDRIMRETI